ncbi:MAG: hypothetical protein H0W09_06245, partial [Solirubrobacterales bacterium]|nr:hypothetical protein [Solirubrobacterales bacterium]
AALVLGAGGSARAAVWALSDAGAEVSVFNRTRARAESLASELGARLVDPPSGEGPLDVEPYGLIVNATSVGLESANSPAREAVIAERLARADLKALRIDADALSEGQTVVDLVYGKRETALVSAARRRRARVVEGIEVLVGQGAESFRIWTALEPPVSSMRSAALSGAQVL